MQTKCAFQRGKNNNKTFYDNPISFRIRDEEDHGLPRWVHARSAEPPSRKTDTETNPSNILQQ